VFAGTILLSRFVTLKFLFAIVLYLAWNKITAAWFIYYLLGTRSFFSGFPNDSKGFEEVNVVQSWLLKHMQLFKGWYWSRWPRRNVYFSKLGEVGRQERTLLDNDPPQQSNECQISPTAPFMKLRVFIGWALNKRSGLERMGSFDLSNDECETLFSSLGQWFLTFSIWFPTKANHQVLISPLIFQWRCFTEHYLANSGY